MGIRRNSESGRQAVTWLATAFVVLIGSVATAVTLLAVAERTGWRDWTIWGILFFGVVVMLWALSGTGSAGSVSSLYSWIRVRNRVDPLTLYKPTLKRHGDGRPIGSNQPPTLDSVREAAETGVQWVPHSQPERERPPRQRKSF